MNSVDRSFFHAQALEVAPRLLGATLALAGEDGSVSIRITEVEAYHGAGTTGPYDAGSHARDRRTDRNAAMFGPPGHAYVYFTYGMHYALNLVCSPEGIASGVLLRAGDIVSGHELARSRREAKRSEASSPPRSGISDTAIARGPGNLAAALGITRERYNTLDLLAAPFSLSLASEPVPKIARGPRVGVSGEAGGSAFPWRFWIPGAKSVSAYRPGKQVPLT
ncbi:DNA-3-methyladenine glycosylase [Leucobacter denitrificans]|uniref:Putative 3-methyladenine DNA glycosylase n=1 Tax=Leucobacter denitrificans TaxID=683042 RepID=A0A7G9S7K4_9MICO|nr:DNA-3-methyladenine glycosylase [Leucobacter denitrificans]QNN63829.1 DNA-3-methyladenine glycosylase [Leucobacter denitrificans]